MVINNIFKAKKNTFVVEVDYEGTVQFTILNLKTYKAETKTYPLKLKQEYIKSKNLKRVTFTELAEALKDARTKVQNKLNRLGDKFLEATDEKTNPEFRHFTYEYVNGLQPMLTEGVVKPLAIYLKMENILSDYELDVALDFDEELESMAFVDLKAEVYGREALDALITNNYCECVAKAKKYVFDLDLVDEDVDDLDETPETEKNNNLKAN